MRLLVLEIDQGRFVKTDETNLHDRWHCQDARNHSKGLEADFGGPLKEFWLLVVGANEKTMHEIVEECLRYKLYTVKVRQMLSEAALNATT